MFAHQHFRGFWVSFFNRHQDPAMLFKRSLAATGNSFVRPPGHAKLRIKIPAKNLEQDRVPGRLDYHIVEIQVFGGLEV